MAAKKGQERKRKPFRADLPPVDPEEAKEGAAYFFKVLEERLAAIPPEEVERGAKKVKAFIDGEVSWAELMNFTPDMLFQMAEFGFTQLKTCRYADAERIFKVLTVLDWNNGYYHSVLASVLQKQKRYGEAIAEYSQAIELDPSDIVSHANKGEILLQHGLLDEAEEDLAKAVALDPHKEDRFANRARILLEQLGKRRAESAKEK